MYSNILRPIAFFWYMVIPPFTLFYVFIKQIYVYFTLQLTNQLQNRPKTKNFILLKAYAQSKIILEITYISSKTKY